MQVGALLHRPLAGAGLGTLIDKRISEGSPTPLLSRIQLYG
jgi:hypothetical protein